MPTAIIAITENGARIGATLKSGIPGSTLHVLQKHATLEALPFDAPLQPLVARLWTECRSFIFIMATGIVVRSIAPLLEGKDKDPAVVVVDDAGRFAVSLVSGHIGGANELAGRCAGLIGATPVITTATDVNELPSFDLVAKQQGWAIDDLSRVKVLNAMLLEGKRIAVVGASNTARSFRGGKSKVSFFDDLSNALVSGADGYVVVSNRILPTELDPDRTLVLRPRNLCLGLGCNRGTSAEEIESVVLKNLEALSLSRKSVRTIATAKAKGDEPGLVAFASQCGVPLQVYESEELNQIEVPSSSSAYAFAAIGAKGVAEPAALLASQGGRLLLKKVKDGNVTLAIAESL